MFLLFSLALIDVYTLDEIETQHIGRTPYMGFQMFPMLAGEFYRENKKNPVGPI